MSEKRELERYRKSVFHDIVRHGVGDHRQTVLPLSYDDGRGLAWGGTGQSSSSRQLSSAKCPPRVVIAMDMDYFYAQVNIVEDKSLQDKPVGVTQQHIVVTCNYRARDFGVKKLMVTTEAVKKCPDLVLINGEDLTKYRAANELVNQVLRANCGGETNIEKLGLDEFFIDATALVKQRIDDKKYLYAFVGWVYPPDRLQSDDADVEVERMLMVGSQVADELRKAVLVGSGLTCCAGISTNKMLAKFAGNLNKPNAQTSMLPHAVASYMSDLPLRYIPGIGSKMNRALRNLLDERVKTVGDLRALYNLPQLECLLGEKTGQWLWSRVCGEDDTVVKNSVAAKVVSVEDSFKSARTWMEVTTVLTKLCSELRERLDEDACRHNNRKPTSLRVVYRHAKKTRESRSGTFPGRKADLLSASLKILASAGLKEPFHLTLLGLGVGGFTIPKPAESHREPTTMEKFLQETSAPRTKLTCPICHKALTGATNNELNQHIDRCLQN